VQDSVRGVGKYLSTNDTDSESTSSTQITSFDSNGFTLGTAISTNDNNDTYVGWAWLAGGSASSNTDGSITSSVSANTKAGFSIVGFTSASSGNFTVGHGLGVTPEVIIQKERGSTGSWHVWHESVTTNTSQYLKLETTGGVASVSNVWGASVPNSTTFGLGVGVSVDANNTQIAYCFHSVRGYSKFGSYTGTGSTDGVFVFTGFRPALLIVKQTDASNRWIIFDNKRGDINPLEEKLELNPNDDTAESSSGTDCFDFLSNGFKLRRSGDVYNGSGHDYIFMAFAEMPFKYANAR
jgi:hypothetical protein